MAVGILYSTVTVLAHTKVMVAGCPLFTMGRGNDDGDGKLQDDDDGGGRRRRRRHPNTLTQYSLSKS